VDLWTLWEKLRIPNTGAPPPGSIADRIAAQVQMGLVPQVSSVGRKATGQEPPKMKSSGAVSESG